MDFKNSTKNTEQTTEELQKRESVFKKYWFVILLAFVATILIVIKLVFTNAPQQPTAPTQGQATWKGITPGKSTVDAVYKSLGEPKSTSSDGSQLFYLREGGGPPHIVVLQGNTVGFVKEEAIAGNLTDIKKKYGEPEGEYFGPNKSVGFKMYIYSKYGFAVNAHSENGRILEIWYFAPTSLSQFLATWGKDLSTQETNGY